MHRLTTSRDRPSTGKRQEIETTVEYNPDHGWRIDVVDMYSDVKTSTNAGHDLSDVLLHIRWNELD